MSSPKLNFSKPDWWGPMHDEALSNASNHWKSRGAIHSQPYIVTDLIRLAILEVDKASGDRAAYRYRLRQRN